MATEIYNYFGTIKVGSTSRLVELVLSGDYDLYSDYTAWYLRGGAASGGTITLQTMSAGTWASGGLVKVNGDVFQFGVPDAVLASGAKDVILRFKDPLDNKWFYRIELPAIDLYDAVRLGLSALPNASPAANGGLPTVDASNLIAGIQGSKNQLDDLNDLNAAAVNAEVDTALSDVGLTTTITGRVDAAVSTRATPAQVNTECDTALADYDAPTKAELDSAASGINSHTTSEVDAAQTDLEARFDTVDSDLASIQGSLVTVQDRTDRLPDNPASTADVVNDTPGGGADQVTLTVTVGGVPVADAQVWITTDSSGSNIVAGPKNTDSNGEVLFLLDDGITYYMWAQKDGVVSVTGTSFVAEAD